jgi:hypothetical protein
MLEPMYGHVGLCIYTVMAAFFDLLDEAGNESSLNSTYQSDIFS